ncbi:hypothetical protein MCOO_39540 [Mycobacterium cookii]|uniref:Uncharacterized protein n=1 Tax=Mycobacterium cookii TaxID=1775 RepID=A0A7I7L1R5_9MYCO|nr:hypothetical protein MCOO_39540 [Mycobacterium cookii]
MQGCVTGCDAHLAKHGLDVAAAFARFEQGHDRRDGNARRHPPAGKVRDEQSRAVSEIACGPTQPRFLAGDEVDQTLQTGFSRGVRGGGSGGGSTRGDCHGLLADTGWCRVGE